MGARRSDKPIQTALFPALIAVYVQIKIDEDAQHANPGILAHEK